MRTRSEARHELYSIYEALARPAPVSRSIWHKSTTSMAAWTQSSNKADTHDFLEDSSGWTPPWGLRDVRWPVQSSVEASGVTPEVSREERKGRPMNIRTKQHSNCRCMLEREESLALNDRVSHQFLSSSLLAMRRPRTPQSSDLCRLRSRIL